MKIVKKQNIDANIISNLLEKGGLIIYPTETVYGVGVDATNENAVNTLNIYKQRPLGKPYSIAVSNSKMAEQYVIINKTANNLYKEFMPGPLTIVSTGKHKVASGVESEYGTLGVRIPNYKIVIDIIKKFGKPITATSANASYKKRPYKISDILDNLSEKQKSLIDLIIDDGELPPNEPSTVIDTTLDDLVVLRQGDIKLNNRIEILSRSEENTQNIAKELWQKYETFNGKRPIIFALEGAMGAGKTQFTKGLAKAMGIKDNVVSPTFNLLNEYSSPLVTNHQSPITNLTHIDAWRLHNSEEIVALGINEILRKNNAVVAIEWAEKVIEVLREHSEDTIIIWVKISYPSTRSGHSANERLISWGSI